MRKSLSTRLMYSYMGLIAVIIIGISVGLSYLVTDYFFKQKEQELVDKGKEVAVISAYFLNSNADTANVTRYLRSVDQLIGARIWLFNENYHLVAASAFSDDTEAVRSEKEGSTPPTKQQAEKEKANAALALIGKQIQQDSPIGGQVHAILQSVYEGRIVNSRIFHPYYKEQVLLVGLPINKELLPLSDDKNRAILLAAPISGLDRVLRDIYVYTGLVGLAALLLSFLIVQQLSKRMVKPLVSMKNSAKAIAAGDYTLKLKVEGEDEISDLGRSLNSLGNDLSRFVQKTKKMEKLRRDFVANVSHELRTPITIIRGYNEAISDGTVTDAETIAKYRATIDNETVRLERLIKELLDISRLQRNEQAELEKLQLSAIVENVAEMLRVKAHARDIRIEQEVDESISVCGDGDRLVQLMVILGDNAIKYSPDKATITLRLYKNDVGEPVFSITDQGYGIPEADIPYIWERFYKVDKSHSRNIPGTGLGLAIAKEIIRLHGAEVEVHSRLGKGTTFAITFKQMNCPMGKGK